MRGHTNFNWAAPLIIPYIVLNICLGDVEIAFLPPPPPQTFV